MRKVKNKTHKSNRKQKRWLFLSFFSCCCCLSSAISFSKAWARLFRFWHGLHRGKYNVFFSFLLVFPKMFRQSLFSLLFFFYCWSNNTGYCGSSLIHSNIQSRHTKWNLKKKKKKTESDDGRGQSAEQKINIKYCYLLHKFCRSNNKKRRCSSAENASTALMWKLNRSNTMSTWFKTTRQNEINSVLPTILTAIHIRTEWFQNE